MELNQLIIMFFSHHVHEVSEENDDQKRSEILNNAVQKCTNTSKRSKHVLEPDIEEVKEPLLELEPQLDLVRIPCFRLLLIT